MEVIHFVVIHYLLNVSCFFLWLKTIKVGRLLLWQSMISINCVIGQSTGIFAPMLKLKEQNDRLSLVKQALHHFNDATLSPLEQVERVFDISSFGENNATGLGMIFHPEEIGLVNKATREILQKMGHARANKQSWRELQDVLRSLHILLRTRDFIELDWFLYLYGRSL